MKTKIRNRILLSIFFTATVFFGTAYAQDTDPIVSYTFEHGLAADDDQLYEGTLINSAAIVTLSDGNHALYTDDGYMDLTAEMGQAVAAQLTGSYTITIDFLIGTYNNLSSFCWLYALANGTSQYLGLINTAGGANWYYEIVNGSTYNNKTSSSVTTGEWHNITVVQRSSQNLIYIDGKRFNTESFSLKPSTFASIISECYLGKSPYSADALMRNTLIDNFKIYAEALSASEITSIYETTQALSTESSEINPENVIYKWENTGNPLITHKYTCDPAAMVYNDTLFIFCGEDATGSLSYYSIANWCCFATTDMKTFWEYDIPLYATDFTWNTGVYAYAGHVIERNGKFYWYVSTNTTGIGVAVADRPEGPYVDALGVPLLTNSDCSGQSHSWRCIDPAVFIDDDDQAWLYWGNGAVWCCKLNDDMISYDASYGIKTIEIDGSPDFVYTEAPWMHKVGDTYYLSYAAGFPEYIQYAISDSPDGPFEYQGIINEVAGNSNTNHQAILEYKDQWYFIYHNGAHQTGGGSYSRSVCIDTLAYDQDGKIIPIKMTTKGVDMITKPNETSILEINSASPVCPFAIDYEENNIIIKDGVTRYLIVNLEGKVVKNGYSDIVDVSNLSRGLYIISNGKESRKFIKS